jgi:hypothetical protein
MDDLKKYKIPEVTREPQIVSVQMTLEEAAKWWLHQEGLCAIDWATLERILSVYRKHEREIAAHGLGGDRLTYDAQAMTYRFVVPKAAA